MAKWFPALVPQKTSIWTGIHTWKYLHKGWGIQVRVYSTWVEQRNKKRCNEDGRKDSFTSPMYKVFICLFCFMVLKGNISWISFRYKNTFGKFTAGRRPPSDLPADGGSPAGVQQAGAPQRPDVIRVPALPGARQPSPELELPSSKLYPFNNRTVYVWSLS